MNKRDLHQIVFDVYGRVLNVSNCYVEEVNLFQFSNDNTSIIFYVGII